jgi:phage shock protein C
MLDAFDADFSKGDSMNLRRSKNDRVIAGVCGGIAENIGISSKKIRIAFVLLVLFAGLSFISYILAWMFIPEEEDEEE